MSNSQIATSSAATTASSSTPIPMLTQQMLARYRELSLEMSYLARERKAINTEIKSLLAAGASVEPGGLTASLKSSESRPLNLRTLRQLFLEHELAWMKSAIEPVTTQRLVIAETPGHTPIVVNGIIGGLPQRREAGRNRP